MNEMTFGGVLSYYMKEQDITLRQLTELLQDMGYHAKYDTLYSYRNELSIPSKETAAVVLKGFGSPLSSKEINDVLKNSRKQKTENADQRYIKKGLRIAISDFDDMSIDQLKTDINIRINDLKKDGIKTFNSYITYLIKKDMSETIWSKRRK